MSNSSWAASPSGTGSALESVESKISPSILFIVAVLAIVFFVCGLLHLLVRHLLRRRRRRRAAMDDAESVTAFQGQLQQLFHLHDAGVDQAFIDALPIFLYRNVVVGGEGGGGKDPFDCAVCLCEFAPDDQLRLLPKCSHAFHLECIDTWLLSHSTCPLCRRSLLAAGDLEPTCIPVLMVLESHSSRDMAASARRAWPADAEPSGVAVRVPGRDGAEDQVVEVKLGKFMCVDGNAGAGDGAGTSSNANADADAGLGQRRCHSMGSYEYVMEEHASLRVAIAAKPPSKKKRPAFSRARRGGGAMSECEFGASKRRGESSLRYPYFPTTTTPSAPKRPPDLPSAAKLAKDSFSESKIWMVPPTSSRKGDPDAAAGGRRTVSFRWPMRSGDKDGDGEGGGERKSGSEADWADVETGSGGGNSVVSSLAEERPSFARRTLLWVVGGRQQSNRVGDCS